MSKCLLAGLLALGLLFAASVVSKAPTFSRWEYLGEANVDGLNDRDNIVVTGARVFQAILIRVENGPMRFDRVVAHFENSDSSPIPMRSMIPPGDQTRVIDMPGKPR
jgi:hypothetical protein